MRPPVPSSDGSEAVLASRARVSARGHADRAVETDGLAVEHRRCRRRARPAWRTPWGRRAGSGAAPGCRGTRGLPREGTPSSGVWNNPGAMVTTRMASDARSRAIGSVMPTMPPLDAEYAAWPICPSNAAIDAVLTMTPRSSPTRSSWLMRSAARRMTLKVPIRLISMMRWKSSRGNAPCLPTVLIALPVPAQLTTTRRSPSSAATSSAAATASASRTSPGAKRRRRPGPWPPPRQVSRAGRR